MVAKPPSLLTGLGEMSATMLTPGMSRRESRNRDETRREELQAVLGQQHDVGLAAERVP